MRLIVQKYGGTSVGDTAKICNVARRLLETQRDSCRVVAVISAMAGVTDNLLKLAREVSPQPTPRELDLLLATGESAASALIASAKYRPGFYHGELTLFSPAGRGPDLPALESVWRTHARTVVVEETAGTHATMLSTLHAETTAACVSRHLSRNI